MKNRYTISKKNGRVEYAQPSLTWLNYSLTTPQDTDDHPLSLGLGVYPKSRFATGTALVINRKADVVLAVGNSFRMPNGTDGRPLPSHVKLIHINADPADLNKVYQADVAILADAKLALREMIDAVRDRLGPGRGLLEPALQRLRATKAIAGLPAARSRIAFKGK